MKKKKAKKHLEKLSDLNEGEYMETLNWFIAQGFGAVSTQYNQIADAIMWQKFNIHFALLDVHGNAKQYSQYYTGLTKFDPNFIGFYPGTYNVEYNVDMETTAQKTIVDFDEIRTLRNKKGGQTFYYGGHKYTITKVIAKHDSDDTWGWQAWAKCTPVKEGIYVRKTQEAYLIFNYGLEGNKERQFYGSDVFMKECLSKFIKKILLNEDDYDNSFLTEPEDAQNDEF